MGVLMLDSIQMSKDILLWLTTFQKSQLHSNFRFHVQPVMWVKAIDMVLDRLVVQGGDLGTVVAIGGSAQVIRINLIHKSDNFIKIFSRFSNMAHFTGPKLEYKH